MDLKQLKDEVAGEKGYPDWETMENFIIDHNHPANVAVLLVTAMEEVCKKSLEAL